MKSILVTGANGYIGTAVARAFVRVVWTTYGLTRSQNSIAELAVEEIIPVIGSIDDIGHHKSILKSLPPTLHAIVSTTESHKGYATHHRNTITLLRTISESSLDAAPKPLVILTSR
jgi:nucleoside-diphosphate-sugar epimerase